ncbi:hypothetical protein DFH28DRAFT_890350, partial [Melampsora americana]
NTKGLNMAPIQPNLPIQFDQSLVGKDFQTILQTVPFVFFDIIMTNQRYLWISLCLLLSYIFKHKITNMRIWNLQF